MSLEKLTNTFKRIWGGLVPTEDHGEDVWHICVFLKVERDGGGEETVSDEY